MLLRVAVVFAVAVIIVAILHYSLLLVAMIIAWDKMFSRDKLLCCLAESSCTVDSLSLYVLAITRQ